ncbi:tyrosine-type recombinase/integrase [Paenibacillus pasadenensis]|uniref:tyrosine-type recombinase/integrase n=1 Tax=Paenibacillus pasadenensis TaxID=217090 RepID=UPI00203D0820|nr:tyrosine-type recombinase/integrase [Paenibacillus pasadenensis]MCM3747337.1 tyrosine-type recombinase/integrase [Paenibacillus pasadenensis]
MDLTQCLYAWLDELQNGRRVSPATYDAYKRDLEHAIGWLEGQGLSTIGSVGRHHLTAYLKACREEGSRSSTVSRRLASIRSFYRFLTKVGYTDRDPSMHVELPRGELARPVPLTLDQVEQLLNAPETDSPAGLRDKAMLELLYGSGVRVSELLAMKSGDPQPGLGYVKVCSPRNKERIVPLGQIAAGWMALYLREGRPVLLEQRAGASSLARKGVAGPDQLFLNVSGEPLSRQGFWKIIKKHARSSGIEDGGAITPHTLRTSFAAHMLERGADLRAVQEMMGHEGIVSTERYAGPDRPRVKDVYEQAHPRSGVRIEGSRNDS